MDRLRESTDLVALNSGGIFDVIDPDRMSDFVLHCRVYVKIKYEKVMKKRDKLRSCLNKT